jgi:hypothetical protein
MIDVTSLIPILGNTSSYSFASSNVYYDIIDISGKGFLSQFYALDTTNCYIYCKITIDDVVVYDGLITSNNRHVGIINLNDVVGKYNGLFGVRNPHSNTLVSEINRGAVSAFPYTGGSDKIMFLNQPLFFHESLLVQLKCSTTATIGYTYEGAYI